MKKNFEDLTLEDFPEIKVDPSKFEEWKEVRETMNSNLKLFWISFFIINLILFISLGAILWGGILLLFILSFITKKFNRLSKELGITQKMIKAALKKEYAADNMVSYSSEYQCSECKKPLPKDGKLCPHCGASFNE